MPEYSKWIDISRYPTVFDFTNKPNEPKKVIPSKIHESLLRSYHIVKEIKSLLSMKTPSEVILDAIKVMEQ
jgi:hypothetical protein